MLLLVELEHVIILLGKVMVPVQISEHVGVASTSNKKASTNSKYIKEIYFISNRVPKIHFLK